MRSSSGRIRLLPGEFGENRSKRAVDELNHIGVRCGCDCDCDRDCDRGATRGVSGDRAGGEEATDTGIEVGDDVEVELMVAAREGNRRRAAPEPTALYEVRRGLLGRDMCPRPQWQRGWEVINSCKREGKKNGCLWGGGGVLKMKIEIEIGRKREREREREGGGGGGGVGGERGEEGERRTKERKEER